MISNIQNVFIYFKNNIILWNTKVFYTINGPCVSIFNVCYMSSLYARSHLLLDAHSTYFNKIYTLSPSSLFLYFLLYKNIFLSIRTFVLFYFFPRQQLFSKIIVKYYISNIYIYKTTNHQQQFLDFHVEFF